MSYSWQCNDSLFPQQIFNTLDPNQPSGVTIVASDEDGPGNNIIEYSIFCDYGEDSSNFGFIINAENGDLGFNTSMGETDRDYECIILVSTYSEYIINDVIT